MPLQPKYRDIFSFQREARLLLPKGSHDTWRLTERVVGEIVGIPNSRGVLTATNGILCVIEREPQRPFLGHLLWFVADKNDEQSLVDEQKQQTTKPTPRKVKELLVWK